MKSVFHELEDDQAEADILKIKADLMAMVKKIPSPEHIGCQITKDLCMDGCIDYLSIDELAYYLIKAGKTVNVEVS